MSYQILSYMEKIWGGLHAHYMYIHVYTSTVLQIDMPDMNARFVRPSLWPCKTRSVYKTDTCTVHTNRLHWTYMYTMHISPVSSG